MGLLANNSVIYGGAANVQALDVAFSIHAHVEARVYDVKYSKKEWRVLVLPEQVVSDINPGATEYDYLVRDRRGSAAIIGNGPNDDIPMVSQAISANKVPIVYAAVGARITDEDARRYSMGFNNDLATVLGEAMQTACENLIESCTLFGHADHGLMPFLNYPGVPVMNAVAGSSGSTEWVDKTGEEILADIKDALTTVIQNTQLIFIPDTMILPVPAFNLIASMPLVLGGVNLVQTILEYVRVNNASTAHTGRPLSIFASKYLWDAGVGNMGRAIFCERSLENQVLPFPMPYYVGEPIQKPLAAEWYAQMKFGSYHVRQPGSMMYLDGV